MLLTMHFSQPPTTSYLLCPHKFLSKYRYFYKIESKTHNILFPQISKPFRNRPLIKTPVPKREKNASLCVSPICCVNYYSDNQSLQRILQHNTASTVIAFVYFTSYLPVWREASGSRMIYKIKLANYNFKK